MKFPTCVRGSVWLAAVAAILLLWTTPARAQIDTFVHNGHTYMLFASADARTWANAVTFAAGLSIGGQPGYLARIDDAGEQARIFQSIMANAAFLTSVAPDGGGGRYVWIGANDITTEGDWRWQDNNAAFWSGGPTGTAVGGRYNNWASLPGSGRTEPDNFAAGPTGQDAAGISVNGYPLGSAGQWNDIATGNVLPFVVEFAAVPEPGSFALAGLGGAILFMSRWRRSRRRA
jgi:hypothetical protein